MFLPELSKVFLVTTYCNNRYAIFNLARLYVRESDSFCFFK